MKKAPPVRGRAFAEEAVESRRYWDDDKTSNTSVPDILLAATWRGSRVRKSTTLSQLCRFTVQPKPGHGNPAFILHRVTTVGARCVCVCWDRTDWGGGGVSEHVAL